MVWNEMNWRQECWHCSSPMHATSECPSVESLPPVPTLRSELLANVMVAGRKIAERKGRATGDAELLPCAHHPGEDCGCYCRFLGCHPEHCPE